MKLIPLSQGQFAQVDDADYEELSKHKWCALWCPLGKGNFYAIRGEYYSSDGTRKNRKHRTIYMHKEILGLPAFPGDKRTVDHKEPSETLNNTRDNLRIATKVQQIANTRIRSHNTTGFKGVKRNGNGYMARLGGKYLGTRSTPEAAHALYAQAAQELHGEFARAA